MSEIRINGVKLDWMAQRILELLAAGIEDEATTRELRQKVPEADNDDIRYRVTRLEEAGCVRTHHQEDGRNNSPKVVFLDMAGRRAFGDHDIDGTPPKESLEARVGALEDEVEELREYISDLRQAIDQLGEAFAQQDVQLKTQQEIRDRLAEIEEKQPEEVREALEAMESIGDSVDELEQRVAHLEEFGGAFAEAVDEEGDQSDGVQDEYKEDESGNSGENPDGTEGKAD